TERVLARLSLERLGCRTGFRSVAEDGRREPGLEDGSLAGTVGHDGGQTPAVCLLVAHIDNLLIEPTAARVNDLLTGAAVDALAQEVRVTAVAGVLLDHVH